jgi:hypothetical protein
MSKGFLQTSRKRSELPAPIGRRRIIERCFWRVDISLGSNDLIVSRIDTFGRVPLENGRSIVAQMEKL